jgi:hypothetical protein
MDRPDTKAKSPLLKQILNKFTRKSAPQAQLAQLPLYEIKARGWDARLNKWRQPVYPALDVNFRNATDRSDIVWNLVPSGIVDLKQPSIDAEALPRVEGKRPGLSK